MIGLREVPQGETEISVAVLGNLISCALQKMPGAWKPADGD